MTHAPTRLTPRRERVRLRVRGVVQGVGYRPFVYRLALRHGLTGWVLNDTEGVLVEASGAPDTLAAFALNLRAQAPAAARVDGVEEVERVRADDEAAAGTFEIRASSPAAASATTLISPDLAVCDDCLRELFDPADARYHYPYITCTNCGPRWSIIESLPYDRARTTMKAYELCPTCAAEYHDPLDRRFHAQPVACPTCGPGYRLLAPLEAATPLAPSGAEPAYANGHGDAVEEAARRLRAGEVLAIKGLGGYHLACDARNERAVAALRERKYRKEKPFALMARDLGAAGGAVRLDEDACALLAGARRPIVLLPKVEGALPDALAPGNAELGVMLPYTPLHHLLFAAGAPPLLVMTSGNRSSEPIAYRDDEAVERLAGLADAFLLGERPIRRRVDDSVVRLEAGRPMFLRRARGYAPEPVASGGPLAAAGDILALGAGMKNAVTLVAGGHAFTSQHLGDLDHLEALRAFEETVADLCAMYGLEPAQALLVHDLHPEYGSSRFARRLHDDAGARTVAAQHHRAHVASVLAERGAWDTPVIGFAFDGSGLGEGSDATQIWGGEVFAGSLAVGLERVAHLRPAWLPGGDAAARRPEQAAVGFLVGQDDGRWRSLLEPRTVRLAEAMITSGTRAPATTSVGRLFDAVAALLGFRRPMTFEGQAAMWLEGLARSAWDPVAPPAATPFRLPFDGVEWDHRPLFHALLDDVARGVPAPVSALRFHRALAVAVADAAERLAGAHPARAVVVSGGVWQNHCLHALAREELAARGLAMWWNTQVSPGDGGISLGQAALAATTHVPSALAPTPDGARAARAPGARRAAGQG